VKYCIYFQSIFKIFYGFIFLFKVKVTEIEAGDSLLTVSRNSFHGPHICVPTFGGTIYTVCKIIRVVVDYENIFA
jgi:hypothetical protein